MRRSGCDASADSPLGWHTEEMDCGCTSPCATPAVPINDPHRDAATPRPRVPVGERLACESPPARRPVRAPENGPRLAGRRGVPGCQLRRRIPRLKGRCGPPGGGSPNESGFRAHGSNQRFHWLLRHAVARALTTAPSLAGVSPAAEILIPQRWRRKCGPGTRRSAPSRASCDRRPPGPRTAPPRR